jgi:hypothetical protein
LPNATKAIVEEIIKLIKQVNNYASRLWKL